MLSTTLYTLFCLIFITFPHTKNKYRKYISGSKKLGTYIKKGIIASVLHSMSACCINYGSLNIIPGMCVIENTNTAFETERFAAHTLNF